MKFGGGLWLGRAGRGGAEQGEHLKDTSMEIISVNLSAITSLGRLKSVWGRASAGSRVRRTGGNRVEKRKRGGRLRQVTCVE